MNEDRLKKLEEFFKAIAVKTLMHGDVNGHAVVFAKDLGDALDKVDPEWYRVMD